MCGGTIALLQIGSIPACAGEPARSRGIVRSSIAVYPRVCGGTTASCGAHLSDRCRSIPACAGEPSDGFTERSIPARARNEVYPRVCGGTHRPAPNRPQGLSPRVRGKPVHEDVIDGGLSPRVRGNPPAVLCVGTLSRVYPRVCGGTIVGSTSAPVFWVYPRVCGGTQRRFRSEFLVATGLSPRVRGNQS